MAVPSWRKAKRKRKPPPVPRKPGLYIEEILRWADAWKARTGSWPKRTSGRIPESSDDKWQNIDSALSIGRRGLPPGLSLARLLAQRRGVRNIKALPQLKVSQILAWADAWKARTGAWPRRTLGGIPESAGDTWCNINDALHKGLRGLLGGSSLAQLLAERRGARNGMRLPHFTISKVLQWADAWKARTGIWPRVRSGPIPESISDTWLNIHEALSRGGRGLPGGSSLARLLADRRGARNHKQLPKFTISKILKWADAWKARTGSWPKRTSGRFPESPGDKWSTIESALCNGRRGLPPGSSLAQLLAERRGVRNHSCLPPFEVSKILAWADAYYRRTGEWPCKDSGPIMDAPGETWMAVDMALHQGHRGLPGGSTLAHLLAQERGRRGPRNLPELSIELLLSWADAHFRRTGAWPKVLSGDIQGVPGEKWYGVEAALRLGLRGLAGGSSLYQMLVAYGRIRPPRPQGLKRRRVEASGRG